MIVPILGCRRERAAQWNSADKDADITLSNGDRDTASVGTGSVRAKIPATAKKLYWETKIITGAPGNLLMGLASSGFSLTTYPGAGANSAGIASFANSVNGWTKAQAGTFSIALNDVLQFALDHPAGYLWVGLNGSWQLTGSPATGANPWITGISGTVYPCLGYVAASATGGRIATRRQELAYMPPASFIPFAAG